MTGNFAFMGHMMFSYSIAISTLSYLLGFLWEKSRKMVKYFNPFLLISNPLNQQSSLTFFFLVVLIIVPNFLLYFSTQSNLETLSLLVKGFAVFFSPSFIFQQGI